MLLSFFFVVEEYQGLLRSASAWQLFLDVAKVEDVCLCQSISVATDLSYAPHVTRLCYTLLDLHTKHLFSLLSGRWLASSQRYV